MTVCMIAGSRFDRLPWKIWRQKSIVFFFTAVSSWGDKCCSDRPGQFCPKIHRLMAQDLWVHGNLGEETAYHSEADEISLNTAVGISWSFNIAIFFHSVIDISILFILVLFFSHVHHVFFPMFSSFIPYTVFCHVMYSSYDLIYTFVYFDFPFFN